MFHLFVEGQGENSAAQKLIQKIIHHCELGNHFFTEGRRIPNIHTNDGLKRAVEIARLDPNTEGVIILRDDEENCPKVHAPQAASFLRSLNFPFPIGYCIMYREFETLFVAYSQEFSGKTVPHVIRGSIKFQDNIDLVKNPEDIRGAKEWVTKQLSGGRVYKPTIDQLSLTQAIEIPKMQSLQLPCFDTLTRCVRKVIENKGKTYVYPE